MMDLGYRYFIALLPDTAIRHWLSRLAEAAGQAGKRVRAERLHLTLCVVAETEVRDRFILPRVEAALAGRSLSSAPIRLGTVRGGKHGAALHTIGRQDEIQELYRAVVGGLATRGLFPLHRTSGLHPHITLGYDPCRFDRFRMPREWIPDALVLIESELGKTIHNVRGRWPLLPPLQGVLPLRCAICAAGVAGQR